MKQPYIWVGLVSIILFAAVIYVRMPKGEAMPKKNQPQTSQAAERVPTPTMTPIDVNKTYTATLETSAGNIVIALTAKATPKTVGNFVNLSRSGFYNSTIFHRVIEGFMIQGGDPKGNGTGGPGYKFDDEPFEGSYTRGTVAMANSGPNTNGSQFFIMHQDEALPPDYVIFGRVSTGMEVVDKIATADTINDGRENSRPVDPVTVQKVTIIEQ